MNKEEIIRYLKKVGFNTRKIVVISEAAMVLQNIKDSATKIDIAVREDYETLLLNNYDCMAALKDVNDIVLSYKYDDVINFWRNYFTYDVDYVDGVPCQKVSDIVFLKKELNRKEDVRDLKLIYKKRGYYE